MHRTIWDLCQEAFGRIPAQWRQRLEALAMAYTPDQLEEAFAIARHHKAKSIEYVVEVAGGLRDKAAEAAGAGAPTTLRCDRCPLVEYVDRMAVVGHEAVCRRCAEQIREQGALNANAEQHEHVVVGRERLQELRAEEPCRMVGYPARHNLSDAERAWEARYFVLEREVRALVRRKSPYMPRSDVENEIKRLVESRRVELGPYPEHQDPQWRVLLRADRAEVAAERPLTATARYVDAHWRKVKAQIGAPA